MIHICHVAFLGSIVSLCRFWWSLDQFVFWQNGVWAFMFLMGEVCVDWPCFKVVPCLFLESFLLVSMPLICVELLSFNTDSLPPINHTYSDKHSPSALVQLNRNCVTGSGTGTDSPLAHSFPSCLAWNKASHSVDASEETDGFSSGEDPMNSDPEDEVEKKLVGLDFSSHILIYCSS